MCINHIIRGPCWCDTNNGQNITLDIQTEQCKFVNQGNIHDKYFVFENEYKRGGRCDKCIGVALEKEREEEERRECERVEAERREEERRGCEMMEMMEVERREAERVVSDWGLDEVGMDVDVDVDAWEIVGQDFLFLWN
ncbi:61fc9e9a-b402-4bd8-b12f-5217ab2e048a [Sclerotinia trifoliorum]|uniref:61fc9e9a-b402-4bd8-b12f-5217ab2e048a n=1 Tax=Sclerotinia trifoliorum TaxID=28548 RepID=A0A8H2W049_9HELO|nr:61fc9e9a-b402-4bd8-b12f-5217ab2e048a [Sclerotinia trifoliorum]